jgi:hypothetical protein
MSTNIEADLDVRRFAFSTDDGGLRFVFPDTDGKSVAGKTGGTAYGAASAAFQALEGRIDVLRWKMDAGTLAGAWLRDDAGRYNITADAIEFPRGILLVRAERGIEIVAPEVTFSELKIALELGSDSSSDRDGATPGPPPAAGLRQERLRFLDSLAGHINVTLAVVLQLPVLGKRTLDQALAVPITNGSLDYRALEDSLDWLEGRFLDIAAAGDKLAVTWKVPIFGSAHDLISWTLDADATRLAGDGRVPVRSLADYKLGDDDHAATDKKPKASLLQAFKLDNIDVALSLLAPRNLEIGGGMIMFGGDGAPGLVDLEVKGSVKDPGAGVLRGAIGSGDLTVKDLALGPTIVTADRLEIDRVDHIEATFDGFKPVTINATIHKVTATNLSLTIVTSG